MHDLIHVSITKWNFNVTKKDTKQPEKLFFIWKTLRLFITQLVIVNLGNEKLEKLINYKF